MGVAQIIIESINQSIPDLKRMSSPYTRENTLPKCISLRINLQNLIFIGTRKPNHTTGHNENSWDDTKTYQCEFLLNHERDDEQSEDSGDTLKYEG